MYFLFFVLVFLSFLHEENNKPCKNKDINIKLLSLLHHFISVYLFLGSFIFGRHGLHLLYTIILWIQWQFLEFTTGEKYCIITRYYNGLCGHDINDRQYILPNHLGIFNILYLILVYDIYHVIRK